MPRNLAAYVDDVIQACTEIEALRVRVQSIEEFQQDLIVKRAAERTLEVIGEAVKKLPPTLLNMHPDVPWRKIGGFRDILIHAYFNIDDRILWDVITKHVEDLKAAELQMKDELRRPKAPESEPAEDRAHS